MVILYILFVCLSLFFPTVVRADTEAITFTSPFLSSKAGLIRPRATHSISLGQQHIRLEAFEDGSLRQPWLLLAPPETNALHEPGSWMLRVSWLAQPGTSLSISDRYLPFVPISLKEPLREDALMVIVTLEPMVLGVLPESLVPLVGVVATLLFGLWASGLVPRILRYIEQTSDEPSGGRETKVE